MPVLRKLRSLGWKKEDAWALVVFMLFELALLTWGSLGQLEAGASYTVTWPTMTWVTSAGNVAPTLTAKDTIVLWKVGSVLYGAYTGSYV